MLIATSFALSLLLSVLLAPSNDISPLASSGRRDDVEPIPYQTQLWRVGQIHATEDRSGMCDADAVGKRSRNRLRALMAPGYRIINSGKRDRSKRLLVRVRLAQGRDAGEVLISEGLAQPWPNRGNRWCER